MKLQSSSGFIPLICHSSIRQPVWVPGLFFVLVAISSRLCSSEEEMWGKMKQEVSGYFLWMSDDLVHPCHVPLQQSLMLLLVIKVTYIKLFYTVPCQAIILRAVCICILHNLHKIYNRDNLIFSLYNNWSCNYFCLWKKWHVHSIKGLLGSTTISSNPEVPLNSVEFYCLLTAFLTDLYPMLFHVQP